MLAWLKSELRQIAEAERRTRFALDMTETDVTLIERGPTGPVRRGTAVHGDADFDRRIAQLRAIVGIGDKAPVDLLLPPSLVLYRIDTFPAEASSDLREAVWWRLDTLTRLKPEELVFDVAKRRTDPATGFIELGLAVAPKDMVAEAIDFARKWRFAPQRVTASEAIEDFPDGPHFASVENLKAATRSLRRTTVVLATAAVVLAMVGVSRAVTERTALADAAAAERSITERTMRQASAYRDAVLAYAEDASAAAERRAEKPLAVEWLGALARTLPPGASASRILVADGVIRIEGVAINPDAVLAAVETAADYGSARYAAALRPAGGAAMRFAIEATIQRDKAAP